MAGASLNRGGSDQTIETPSDFFSAIVHRFGRPELDLAATIDNRKCPQYIGEGEDSLTVDWMRRLNGRIGYLNPPFDPVEPWVTKCAEEYQRGSKILLLCRASVDSNWYWDHVHPNAVVYALTPRIKFVGQNAGYPSPLVLCTFNVLGVPGGPIQRWRWK